MDGRIRVPGRGGTSQMPNLIAGVQIDKVAKHGRRVVDDAAHGRESLFERRVKGHRRHVGGRAWVCVWSKVMGGREREDGKERREAGRERA